MAQLPSTGLGVVPQPLIAMARFLGGNASVGARHRPCNWPMVFYDVIIKVNARPFVMCDRLLWRHSRGDGPPDYPYRGSVPILGRLQKGN